MDLPKFHCFPSHFLEAVDNDLCECEIHVLRTDDIAWSIVLSYLMHRRSKTSSIDEFRRRVFQLTDCDEDFLRNVEKSVLRFNPFQNRRSYFHDEFLKKVVSSFTEKLQWASLSITRKLQAASDFLQCSIVKITKNDDPEMELICPRGSEVEDHSITLFQSDKTGSIFSFGIQKEIGLKLQKMALTNALKSAAIPPRIIGKFLKIVNAKNSFITAVLKSNCDCKNFIPELYQSSYAMHKLVEAGFVTDPTVEDEKGYPALFYSLTHNNYSIVYSLFFYACNAYYKSTGTYREPDMSVIDSLKKMREVLFKLRLRVKKSELLLKKQNIISQIEELSLLNQFLINVNSEIYDIKSEVDLLEDSDHLEASKRKRILVCILNAYEEFFICSEVPASISALDDYKQKKVFYKMIDSICAILFFDNIFLLKERVKVEDEYLYSAMESFFYLTVRFDRTIFPHCKTLYLLSNLQKPTDSFFLVSVFLRMALKDKIISFKNKLQETNIDDNNILKSLPKQEIFYTFGDFPEMKDEILIRKLKFYINSALSVKVEDIKSSLVIERALQVIGEDVIFSRQPKSVRRLLALSITKKQHTILKNLRNQICHLEKESFSLKLKVEKNLSLFSDIKREISKVKGAFLPIIDIQNYRVTHCVINFVGKLITEAQLRGTQIHNVDLKELSICWRKVVRKSNELWKEILQISIRKHFKKYKIIFENIFQYMEETLKDDSFWKSDDNIENQETGFVAKAKDVVWPMQFMLTIFKESNAFILPENVIEMCKDDWLNNKCTTVKDATTKIGEFMHTSTRFTSFLDLSEDPMSWGNFSINSIEKLRKTLKGSVFLSEAEKSVIRNEIPPLVREAKQIVLKSIETETFIEQDERDYYFNALLLSKKKRKELKKTYPTKLEKAKLIVEASGDPVQELEDMLSKNRVQKEMLTMLDEVVHFSEQSKLLLSRLIEGQKKDVSNGDNLSVFLNRIGVLKNILIEECIETSNLWNGAKNKKTKEYAVHKVTQRFMENPHIQASTEMLLLDCMQLINASKAKDKGDILVKMSKLYNGVSLRNTLAHGSPMLENIGLLLDIEDVPSALVKKMLQLVEDEPVIKSMGESGLDFCMFHKMMNSDGDENGALRSGALKCERWQLYSYLIPEKHKNPSEENRRGSLKPISEQEEI